MSSLFYYLLLCDWNLMFRSVCAEYEIRKWHEPTCSGSKYLKVNDHITKLTALQTIPKIQKLMRGSIRNGSAYLGILLPSKAFLAADAVSASLN